MTDLITMLGEIIVNNMTTLYWIFMPLLLIAGIVLLKAKDKLGGVFFLAAGVFLLILYRIYPISPQPYRVELIPVITGVTFIVGICVCFGFIIDAVMKYTRGRKKISEETPVERMLSRVQPEQKVPPKQRAFVDLDERLGVLRGEIRRLIGYHTEDLKDEIGKISEMIKDGYWVQAGNALATLEGKVMDRKTEKDKYDQFMARVNEFVKERTDLFVDDIKAQLSKGDFDKAEQILVERKKDYERYLELGRSLKDVEEQTTMLSTRLARGELSSDAYERARNDLDRRKYDIDEELWKIQRKIFREKYEKPF